MILSFTAIIVGLVLLVWSADRFVDGAAVTARKLGVPVLIIGMVVVGFGTSAPELLVSALASLEGNSQLALGNAYGSNIANIALVLGVTALISPIVMHRRVLRKDLPVLVVVTLLAGWLVRDGELSHVDGVILLLVFATWMAWLIWMAKRASSQDAAAMVEQPDVPDAEELSTGSAVFWVVAGLAVLLGSSRLLIWGAVELASGFGVSDLIIGLTVVGVGTSLPELASSVVAVRKGEHDIALGNVLGSNVFNTLAVVGIASVIRPMSVAPEVLRRDVITMGALTVLLFAFGIGFGGRLGRVKGAALMACYAAYLSYLIYGQLL